MVGKIYGQTDPVSSETLITALHGMQTRSSDEISVCPSGCPSVKRVHCDKTEEKWVGATPSI